MSTVKKAGPRAEAVSLAGAGIRSGRAAAHIRVRPAAAHIRAVAGHNLVRQAAAHSRAAADTARHRGGICGRTAPGASPAGTPSAGHKRSSRAQPAATQSNSQCGRSCRDFPIPRFSELRRYSGRIWTPNLTKITARCGPAAYAKQSLTAAPLAKVPASYGKPEPVLMKVVRPRGLEPPRVAPLAPQASASTNSATAACGVNAP